MHRRLSIFLLPTWKKEKELSKKGNSYAIKLIVGKGVILLYGRSGVMVQSGFSINLVTQFQED
jgi:hypothetical protein